VISDETLSVGEQVLASNIKIYPNPVQDLLKIDFNNVEVTSIKIYNLLGKQVFEQNGMVDKSINVSNLTSGMYLMKVATNMGQLNKRIVID